MRILPAPLATHGQLGFAEASFHQGDRVLAEETAIAFSYDGATHAVMMGTPADLEDFALGFSLTEGIIATPADIEEMEVVPRGPLGIEVRMYLSEATKARLVRRSRAMAGPAGCGLCGIQALEDVARTLPHVCAGLSLRPSDIAAAMSALSAAQPLNRQARAIHAAGFWRPQEGLLAVAEDVGRHNALDKVAGKLARSGVNGATGLIALTSRVSVELIQKAARIGAPVIAAISAPTALAVRTAEACGITLIAVARDGAFEAFTHTARIHRGAHGTH